MAKRIARDGVLLALALILYAVEAQIPSPVPVPGVKLGISNIITLAAMFCIGPADALCILVCRIVMGQMFAGNAVSLIYAVSGGLLSYLVMYMLHKAVTHKQIWVCSVFSAAAHGVGQILSAAMVMKTTAVFIYIPFLVCSGIITGLFTGLCAGFVIARINNNIK